MVKKLIVFIILFILVLIVIGYNIVGNYFYNIALNPKTDKTFVLKELGPITESEEKKAEERAEWLNTKSNDVYITSTNNGELKLHAYEVLAEEETDTWVIIVHGYISQGAEMTGFAQQFYQRNYNSLVVDLRGHGKSEGDYVGMGWHDRLDVIDWINYVIGKNEDSKIILFGISMGGATVMMTTGENMPENIKLAIEDCGYSSVWDEFSHQLKLLFKLPDFPVLNAADSICNRKAHYKFKEASSVEQVKKSVTPTLFIHGAGDNFVPIEMLDKVYEAANCEKEKLVIEGAVHAMASTVDPHLYWETVDRFISKYI